MLLKFEAVFEIQFSEANTMREIVKSEDPIQAQRCHRISTIKY